MIFLLEQHSWSRKEEYSFGSKSQYIEKSPVFTVSDLTIWETKYQAHRVHPYWDTKDSSQFIHNTRPIPL